MKKQIVDMFNNLKNGQLAKKKIIFLKNRIIYPDFLNILWDEGFIAGYTLKNNLFNIFLKYKDNNKPAINSIKFISKPGHKIYYKLNQLWKLNHLNTLIIISTNKGLMSLQECKKHKIGGQPLVIIN